MCRSEPQIAVDVTFKITSRECSSFGSSTSFRLVEENGAHEELVARGATRMPDRRSAVRRSAVRAGSAVVRGEDRRAADRAGEELGADRAVRRVREERFLPSVVGEVD